MTFKMIIWMFIINSFKESNAADGDAADREVDRKEFEFKDDVKTAIREYEMSKEEPKKTFDMAMRKLRPQVDKCREEGHGHFQNWEQKDWERYRDAYTRQVRREMEMKQECVKHDGQLAQFVYDFKTAIREYEMSTEGPKKTFDKAMRELRYRPQYVEFRKQQRRIPKWDQMEWKRYLDALTRQVREAMEVEKRMEGVYEKLRKEHRLREKYKDAVRAHAQREFRDQDQFNADTQKLDTQADKIDEAFQNWSGLEWDVFFQILWREIKAEPKAQRPKRLSRRTVRPLRDEKVSFSFTRYSKKARSE